jgi:beta-N-acetylhexosaminidase
MSIVSFYRLLELISQVTVTIFDPSLPSEPLHALWESTVGTVEGYSLPSAKFAQLLTWPLARTFIVGSPSHPRGFAITYLIRSGSKNNQKVQHLKGAVAAIIVDPSSRGQGFGTALHEAAYSHLTKSVRESFTSSTPNATSSVIQLGSTFPRLFPGIPEGEEFADARKWFTKRGWTFKDEVSIDLYQSVDQSYVVPEKLLIKPRSFGITFGPPTLEDDKELYRFQEEEFGESTVSFMPNVYIGSDGRIGMARYVPCFDRIWSSGGYHLRFQPG